MSSRLVESQHGFDEQNVHAGVLDAFFSNAALHQVRSRSAASIAGASYKYTHSGVLFRGYFFSLSHFWCSFPLLPILTKLTPSKLLLPAFPGGVLLSATMPVFLGRTWKRS